ncbi:MAG TPA: hypothetical protein PLF59_08085 [Cyclobacteriaceae bacterium]|nr:hypothetical protein [Cyclobacteriaceae bacterium]
MLKTMLTLGLLATSLTAMADNLIHKPQPTQPAQESSVNDNTYYARNAREVLEINGYQKIRIIGKVQGFCTIAGGIWDWNAASFTVVSKQNVPLSGVVCDSKIYFTQKENHAR